MLGSIFSLWAGGLASCSVVVSLVSMRNANNSNHLSWENWLTNVDTVSHTASVFDKETEPKKTNHHKWCNAVGPGWIPLWSLHHYKEHVDRSHSACYWQFVPLAMHFIITLRHNTFWLFLTEWIWFGELTQNKNKNLTPPTITTRGSKKKKKRKKKWLIFYNKKYMFETSYQGKPSVKQTIYGIHNCIYSIYTHPCVLQAWIITTHWRHQSGRMLCCFVRGVIVKISKCYSSRSMIFNEVLVQMAHLVPYIMTIYDKFILGKGTDQECFKNHYGLTKKEATSPGRGILGTGTTIIARGWRVTLCDTHSNYM